jgi:glycerophosphoryl diester phosphodiesterase
MLFELQGHRGARGLKPENTLPSFEAALDIGVSSIESDVHLTRDGVPVICHDPDLGSLLSMSSTKTPLPRERKLSLLTLAEVRQFRVDRNPEPQRFPEQDNSVTPAAQLFAQANNMDPYGVPTLADFIAFVAAYAGPLGERTGKSAWQRQRADQLRFDLELKRVPFEPHTIGDDFDGVNPGLLERRIVEEVRKAGVVERTIVRSFDHRSVRALRQLEPRLTTVALISGTALISPVAIAHDVGATIYAPEYRFVDKKLIDAAHSDGLRVIPWTVNGPEIWERLIAWGVDGLTTDHPDRLGAWLAENGITAL